MGRDSWEACFGWWMLLFFATCSGAWMLTFGMMVFVSALPNEWILPFGKDVGLVIAVLSLCVGGVLGAAVATGLRDWWQHRQQWLEQAPKDGE